MICHTTVGNWFRLGLQIKYRHWWIFSIHHLLVPHGVACTYHRKFLWTTFSSDFQYLNLSWCAYISHFLQSSINCSFKSLRCVIVLDRWFVHLSFKNIIWKLKFPNLLQSKLPCLLWVKLAFHLSLINWVLNIRRFKLVSPQMDD